MTIEIEYMINQINKEKRVVMKNFFLIFGSSGAPGSLPFLTFFELVIPKGKNRKRDNHHIIKYNTIPLDTDTLLFLL